MELLIWVKTDTVEVSNNDYLGLINRVYNMNPEERTKWAKEQEIIC